MGGERPGCRLEVSVNTNQQLIKQAKLHVRGPVYLDVVAQPGIFVINQQAAIYEVNGHLIARGGLDRNLLRRLESGWRRNGDGGIGRSSTVMNAVTVKQCDAALERLRQFVE
jgi:hypothetical protein